MTHAQTFADQRATAYLRMGVADMYQSITPGDHVREEHDRELDEWRERATAEVWCAHCDQPAVLWALLTTGETRGYCIKHAPRVTLANMRAEERAARALRLHGPVEDDPRIQHEAVEL